MFSEKLKQLVEYAVTDGNVTEKEMNAIARRATEEGVDLDELEIYIDSCIQKKNMEAQERAARLEAEAQERAARLEAEAQERTARLEAEAQERAARLEAQERAARLEAQERAARLEAQERAASQASRAEQPDNLGNTIKSVTDVVSGFKSGNMGSKADTAIEVAKSLFDVLNKFRK